MSLSDKSTVDMVGTTDHALLDIFVRHALSSLLCLVGSGLMEKDAPIAPMTMGVKEL